MGENMPLTPDEFTRQMAEIIRSNDIEEGHMEADKLMCQVLRELGYGEGVKLFMKQSWWYA